MKKSRVLLWFVVIAISITGVALYFMAPPSEDELPHPLNGLFRELHGVASAMAIFIFGYFFADHVQKKLAKYKNHWSAQVWDGYLHLTVWVVLIISGLLLYYPQESLNAMGISIADLHWYAGLILIGLFPLHFWHKAITRYQSRKRWEKSVAQKEH
ncbi:MAG: hypothetical protein V4660_00260 [Pseudomonadota bacterium]